MPVFHTDKVMEAILEMIDEGIHVIDMDGKTIFYNQVAASHDGMSVEEVLGVPLLQAFPELTDTFIYPTPCHSNGQTDLSP